MDEYISRQKIERRIQDRLTIAAPQVAPNGVVAAPVVASPIAPPKRGLLRRTQRKVAVTIVRTLKITSYRRLMRVTNALDEARSDLQKAARERDEILHLLRTVAPDRDRLAGELEALRGTHEQALADLERARRQLAAAQQNESLESALAQVSEERDVLRDQSAVLQRQTAEQAVALAQMTGQQNVLQTVLHQVTDERNDLRERLMTQERHFGEQTAALSQNSTQRETLQNALAQVTQERDWLRAHMNGIEDQVTLPTTITAPARLPNEDAVKALLASSDLTNSDTLYLALETGFRGSKADIKQRQAQYLPLLPLMQTSLPVVDLGCGRGEFLELLRDHGMKGIGVDTNAVTVGELQAAGFEVYQQDALEYLRAQEPASLAAVTAFQMIEHLPQPNLLELLRTAHEKIAPGGFILLETVNPYCLDTFRTFYLDPTHKAPIPPDLLNLLVQVSGFEQTTYVYQNPTVGAISSAQQDVQYTFYQNYAVLGVKPVRA